MNDTGSPPDGTSGWVGRVLSVTGGRNPVFRTEWPPSVDQYQPVMFPLKTSPL